MRGARCDAVLAGWYRQELSFEVLEAACLAVIDGAQVYSAFCVVTVVGKPSLSALRTAARRLGVEPSELAVVGDDPELEVPMAHAGGAFAVVVHTGIGHAESFTDLPADVRPHLDLPDVGALAQLLRG
jgi:NagD protein